MKTTQSFALTAAVDRLAIIKKILDDLTVEEKTIKTQLAESGHNVIEGTLHRAAVSICAGRDCTDWAAIAAKFGPSRQLIKAHTTTGAPYAVVRLSAKKGS